MNKKNKLIGSITILVIAVILVVSGYISLNRDKNQYDDVFIEYDKNINNEENKDENTADSESFNKSGDKSLVEEIQDSELLEEIKVDVKGAIKYPGIYTLKKGERVADLIELAGGLTEEADYNSVYLSRKLVDEDFVYVKKIGEEMRTDITLNITDTVMSNEKEKGIAADGKVNINKATLEELKTLPGIGDVKAQSIIDYRNSHGNFKSIRDLLNVDGIGEKTFSKFEDMLTY